MSDSETVNVLAFRQLLEAEGVEHDIDWDGAGEVSVDDAPEAVQSYLVLDTEQDLDDEGSESGALFSDEFDEDAEGFEPEDDDA